EDQRRVERGERIIVGINKHQESKAEPIPTLKIDPEVERSQVARIEALRHSRDAAKVASSLASVRAACQSGENLVAPIVTAVENDVTVGEICDVFREEFGVYRDPAFV
ncbi:MAG: methylmalonyl-CoA mutase family protein, partial [Myxococcota bacterium]|nr:methylmalonyl-CoA mutase family protein [Myxococcota bacterium]